MAAHRSIQQQDNVTHRVIIIIRKSPIEFLEYVGVVGFVKKMCYRINHPRFANLKSFTKSTPQDAGKKQLSAQ